MTALLTWQEPTRPPAAPRPRRRDPHLLATYRGVASALAGQPGRWALIDVSQIGPIDTPGAWESRCTHLLVGVRTHLTARGLHLQSHTEGDGLTRRLYVRIITAEEQQ
ncbi:hypothetical protein CSPHI_04885 [Corynebacterium sphenisci DSM 44792]|uniref:Uncharacterized protein n=1 Tax=Corynebacterium sphenisci DSM 44792 TaxID=1437874 RepID=A0A1L7CXB1_9CORY|nr:hypothetical protein [Corynebacterium sphenisci]APT90484.1 hypothetical protein CSPHI_04885 [Corynebacterium sphenisci DSM 44792]